MLPPIQSLVANLCTQNAEALEVWEINCLINILSVIFFFFFLRYGVAHLESTTTRGPDHSDIVWVESIRRPHGGSHALGIC